MVDVIPPNQVCEKLAEHHVTELGPLPQDWQVARLGDIAPASRQSLDPANHPDEEFEYYSIPSYRETGKPSLEQGRNIHSIKTVVRDDIVLFGKLNPRVPKVWRVAFPSSRRYIASTEFIALSPQPERIDSQFLYYLCWSDHVMSVAQTLVSGSTPSRQRVDPAAFLDLTVPLPPLPEQRAIAHVLSAVQRAGEATDAVIAATRELKKSLMRHLFTYGPVPVDRAEQAALKETEIGSIRQDWRLGPIGSEVTLQRGFDITKKEQRPGSIPVVSSGGISSYHDTALVEGPGVVIGRKGTLGTAYYLQGSFWPHDTTLWVKDFHGNNPRFVYYFFKNLDVKSLDVGATNPTLNRNHVHPITVGWPPVEQQRVIANILDSLESKLEAEISLSCELETLFKALLFQLMTGQVRVNAFSLDQRP